MGKVTKNISKKDSQQNKNKRKGRPPKKHVQQIDSSDDEDSLSVRHASTRSRVVSIRSNEIPMRPEIHITPALIPSSNNLNNTNNTQLSSDGSMQSQSEPQHTSTATSSRITITMTSITKNNTENSNTTTYVTTEILPMMGFPQPDNSENRPITTPPNIANIGIIAPINSPLDSLNNLYLSNGSYPTNAKTKAVMQTSTNETSTTSFIQDSKQDVNDASSYSQIALNGLDSSYHQTSNSLSNIMASSSYSQVATDSQVNDLRTKPYHNNNAQSKSSDENINMEIFDDSTASNSTSQDVVYLNSHGNSVNPLPIGYKSRHYRVPDIDTLGTVHDVWDEWNVGICGNPSIISLMETYGNKWQLNNSVNLATRKKIIKVIQLRAVDIGLDEALDEMKKIMGSNRLSWLADHICKKEII